MARAWFVINNTLYRSNARKHGAQIDANASKISDVLSIYIFKYIANYIIHNRVR